MLVDEFNVLYAIFKNNVVNKSYLSDCSGVSSEVIDRILLNFIKSGLIDSKGITRLGIEALSPYKVDNAVIMAAGMSTRFVPLSLEKPKGLLRVKGEILIERQINQLIESGIKNIVIVLGYMKESFLYLKEKYKEVSFIINPYFDTRNNAYTLFLAKDVLKNTYICSSDDYFINNPFEEYVYCSYYASIHINESSDEWYIFSDQAGNISQITVGGTDGDIMYGHVYWSADFSQAMSEILIGDQQECQYQDSLWERILKEHLKDLPSIKINKYPEGTIYEFDSLEDLRNFDTEYCDNCNSRIMDNITSLLKCKERDIGNFRYLGANKGFIVFEFDALKKTYEYKHPLISDNWSIIEK